MLVLFYDSIAPLAYDATTGEKQGLGGTEATVTRISGSLKNAHQVYVAQAPRATADNIVSQGVHYISLETARDLKPDVVILLRQYREAEKIARLFPKARRYLWLHNLPSRELSTWRETLVKHGYQIIAVSHFHRGAIERRLRGKWYQNIFKSKFKPQELPIRVLYNPIDDDLQPDNSQVKPEQLLFMSAPEKGLPETLKMFDAVRQVYPEYQLLIANPGYSPMELQLRRQARFLGALARPEIMQHLRESFCVFYPQAARVETFGLIYAEANAVGTPVLAHDSGAAREVLSDVNQLVNGREISSILSKLAEWREKRPVLRARPEFRLNSVRQTWLDLLEKVII